MMPAKVINMVAVGDFPCSKHRSHSEKLIRCNSLGIQGEQPGFLTAALLAGSGVRTQPL